MQTADFREIQGFMLSLANGDELGNRQHAADSGGRSGVEEQQHDPVRIRR